MQQSGEIENFEPRYRIDEEYEYYTELATNASQLWIESILHKRLPNQDDFRKSLEDGVILCELLNTLRPGCIKKINRLPSKIAGIDNLSIFLQTCADVFSLHEKQLFQVSDLEDLSERAIPANQLADEQGKRIRRVLTTIFYLGKAATGLYDGSPIDFSAFTGIVTACPPTPITNSGHQNGSNGSHSEDKTAVSREIESPVNDKTSSAPSTSVRQSRVPDHSPSRLSDAGSFDSGPNVGSNQSTQQRDLSTVSSSNKPQHRNSQGNSHHFVKSGFSLPVGGSKLTRTAVEQMRLISESRASGSFQAPVARQSSLAANPSEDDAWQSDLDVWRMRRKQSLQSTLPAEVLQSVGLLEGESLPPSQQSEAKKSNKKPGLLSKLRYSVDLDSDDPLVVNLEDQQNSVMTSFSTSLKEQLPPIADNADSKHDLDKSNERADKSNVSDLGQDVSDRSNSSLTSPQNGTSVEKDGFRDFVFKISQQPGNLRGFGFTIKGGRDSQLPLTVDRVTAGSAADEADVQANDEILKINNESVESYFRPTLNRLIQQCVKAGQIALTIRRYTKSSPQAQMNTASASTAKTLQHSRSLDVPPKAPVASTPGLNGRRLPVKESDVVDNGTELRSSRFGPGYVATEPASAETTVSATTDESDQWLRSQAVGTNKQSSFTSAVNNSIQAQQTPRQPQPTSSSPTLSSSSSSTSSGQRYIVSAPRYRGSPSQQQHSSSSGSSVKDDSQSSSVTQEDLRNSTSTAPGAILVRGGSQGSSLPVPEANGSVNQTTTTDQTSSTVISNGSAGRSPYYFQQQPGVQPHQSMIPQPWSQNSNGISGSPSAPPPQQANSDSGFFNGSNGSVPKENGLIPTQPQSPQPPQQQQQPQTQLQSPPQLPRSVSSRELCAACSQSLGAGPAMAIERLGLFYHVRCFRCSVCKVSLSNGQTGVDVRVKGARLHCQNCNSSDESGLQSSQV